MRLWRSKKKVGGRKNWAKPPPKAPIYLLHNSCRSLSPQSCRHTLQGAFLTPPAYVPWLQETPHCPVLIKLLHVEAWLRYAGRRNLKDMEQIIGIQSDVIKHSSYREETREKEEEEGKKEKSSLILWGLIPGSRYSSVHRVVEGGARPDPGRSPS